MRARVLCCGWYAILETRTGRRLLALNGERCFEWGNGERGEALTTPEPGREASVVLVSGSFLLLEETDGVGSGAMARLYLADAEEYQELLLPDGLPCGPGSERRVVRTSDMLAHEELCRYWELPALDGAVARHRRERSPPGVARWERVRNPWRPGWQPAVAPPGGIAQRQAASP